MSLWALHLKAKLSSSQQKKHAKFFNSVLRNMIQRVFIQTYLKMKAEGRRNEFLSLRLKSILLRRKLKNLAAIRRNFLKFLNKCKEKDKTHFQMQGVSTESEVKDTKNTEKIVIYNYYSCLMVLAGLLVCVIIQRLL